MRHSPEPFSVPLSVKAQVMAQGLDPIEATERADRKECSIGKFRLLEVEATRQLHLGVMEDQGSVKVFGWWWT